MLESGLTKESLRGVEWRLKWKLRRRRKVNCKENNVKFSRYKYFKFESEEKYNDNYS